MAVLTCPNCGKANNVAGWLPDNPDANQPFKRHDPTCHYRDVQCVYCGVWWFPNAVERPNTQPKE